jgi:hypothetical protein
LAAFEGVFSAGFLPGFLAGAFLRAGWLSAALSSSLLAFLAAPAFFFPAVPYRQRFIFKNTKHMFAKCCRSVTCWYGSGFPDLYL